VFFSDYVKMDILPSGNIFRELQDIHDTGYFSAQPSLEDHWQQVGRAAFFPAVRPSDPVYVYIYVT
jgi:krueppel-like factor 6/7